MSQIEKFAFLVEEDHHWASFLKPLLERGAINPSSIYFDSLRTFHVIAPLILTPDESKARKSKLLDQLLLDKPERCLFLSLLPLNSKYILKAINAGISPWILLTDDEVERWLIASRNKGFLTSSVDFLVNENMVKISKMRVGFLGPRFLCKLIEKLFPYAEYLPIQPTWNLLLNSMDQEATLEAYYYVRMRYFNNNLIAESESGHFDLRPIRIAIHSKGVLAPNSYFDNFEQFFLSHSHPLLSSIIDRHLIFTICLPFSHIQKDVDQVFKELSSKIREQKGLSIQFEILFTPVSRELYFTHFLKQDILAIQARGGASTMRTVVRSGCYIVAPENSFNSANLDELNIKHSTYNGGSISNMMREVLSAALKLHHKKLAHILYANRNASLQALVQSQSSIDQLFSSYAAVKL
jgi:hypothetical protein